MAQSVRTEFHRRFARRGALALAAAVTLTLALTGCGSDASGGRGGGGNGVAAGDLAAAEAAVKDASTYATNITITEPLPEKPTPGKTLAFISCDIPSCVNWGKSLKEATAAVGWHLQSVPMKVADPASMTSAMRTALRYDPVAVVMPGFNQSIWASVKSDYEAAQVPLILTGYVPADKWSSGIYTVQGPPYYERQGSAIASWFAANSKGKGKALVVYAPEYAIFAAENDGFKKTLQEQCPDCTTEELKVTQAQVSGQQAPGLIVAALRRDPKITHVVALSGSYTTGLPNALAAAGLQDKVTVGAALARADSVGEMLAGHFAVLTNQAEFVAMYYAMDIALRLDQGAPVLEKEASAGPKVQLLTPENTPEPVDSVDTPLDYAEQFAKLWQAN